MDERDYYSGRPRRGVVAPLLVLFFVFVAGVVLAGVAVHRWERLANWLHPDAAPPVNIARPIPVASMPIAPPPVVEKPAVDPALTAKVEELDNRVDTIDEKAQAASGDADRAEGLLVAFAARRSIDRGQPLGYVEGLLRKHFGATDAQAVSMVIGAAQRPVTLLMLQNELADLAPKLEATGPQEGWWAGIRREMGSLFVVRQAQTPSKIPSDQQDRAARALAQGQVETALGEVLRMPGAAQATGWIAEARRYVLAHNALDRIEAAALLKPPAPVVTN